MDRKKILQAVSVVILAAVVVAGVYVYNSYKAERDNPESASGSTAQTEELPSYGTDSPLENKPDLNPVSKTNPFKALKTNPFE